MKRVSIVSLVLAVVLLLAGAPLSLAQQPTQPAPPDRTGAYLIGRVSEVGAMQLTLVVGEQTWKVSATASTVVRLPGAPSAGWQDIKAGTVVLARGKITAANTMDAELITAPPEPLANLRQLPQLIRRARQVRGMVKGEIASLGQNQFAVKAGERQTAIAVDAETKYRVPNVENATIADLRVGQLVMVEPVDRETETLTAKTVVVVTKEGMQRAIKGVRTLQGLQRLVGLRTMRGQVVSVQGNQLVLTTPRGQVTVNVSEDTKFSVPGAQDATLGALKVGDTVVVRGRPSVGSPIDATRVAVVSLPTK